MSTATLTENSVARNKRAEPHSAAPDPVPSFERIEFQAPLGFTASLDKACKKRGLSRAAYIRQAVLLLIERDKESLQP